MSPLRDHVAVHFHEPLEPHLRRVDEVDVACHLHDPEALARA
jgi:hypothetical protein